MKKTLVLISVLAAMAMTFAGCDANIEVNTPGSSEGAKETVVVTIAEEKDEPAVTEITEETEIPAAPAVSVGTEAVSEPEKETETKKESSICEKLAENAANGSPLAKGYKASGYSDMMDRYYNVSYTDDGYTYSLNKESVMLGTASFLLGSEGTVVSASSENISEEDEKNFEKLLEYVNGKAGEGNYSIHDAFTEDYEETYGLPGDEDHKERNSVSGKVTHIEIVLNSDLDKYTAAADADKAKYVVKFEVSDDGDIKSEYEYYGKTKEVRNDLLKELNALSSDYAYGIDQCTYDDYDGVLTEVHTPFFSADRKAVVNGEEAEFWLNKARRSTAVSESKGDADDSYRTVYLSVYCKPGTDTSSLVSVLEELYPVTSKYDVTYVNIDVLENESDFERYRNSDGIIPEETIKSAHREWHFNNPEFGWGVPGK